MSIIMKLTKHLEKQNKRAPCIERHALTGDIDLRIL